MSAAADVVTITIMKNMHKSIATKSMSIIITNMATVADAVMTTAMRSMSIIITNMATAADAVMTTAMITSTSITITNTAMSVDADIITKVSMPMENVCTFWKTWDAQTVQQRWRSVSMNCRALQRQPSPTPPSSFVLPLRTTMHSFRRFRISVLPLNLK